MSLVSVSFSSDLPINNCVWSLFPSFTIHSLSLVSCLPHSQHAAIATSSSTKASGKKKGQNIRKVRIQYASKRIAALKDTVSELERNIEQQQQQCEKLGGDIEKSVESIMQETWRNAMFLAEILVRQLLVEALKKKRMTIADKALAREFIKVIGNPAAHASTPEV